MSKKNQFFAHIVIIVIFLNTPIWAQVNLENRSSSWLQSIIDAVDIDSIYQTERHITGEETFFLNGQLDSILSRYSYSTGITVAQNYLGNRFEKMGYTVELQTFMNSLNFY